jgi:cell division septal protein FtsQ
MVNVAVPNYPYALGSAFVKKKKNKEEEEEEERKKKKERGLALLYQPIILWTIFFVFFVYPLKVNVTIKIIIGFGIDHFLNFDPIVILKAISTSRG